jgi:hypothetical protein
MIFDNSLGYMWAAGCDKVMIGILYPPSLGDGRLLDGYNAIRNLPIYWQYCGVQPSRFTARCRL